MNAAVRQRSENTAIAEDLRFERRIVGKHRYHNSRPARLGRRGGNRCAICAQSLRSGTRAVENGYTMTTAQEALRHSGAHTSKTNQTYFHSSLQISRIYSVFCG